MPKKQLTSILEQFSPKPLPEAFVRLRKTTLRKSLSIFALMMLYTTPMFSVLDYLMKPHLFIPLLILRLSLALIALQIHRMMKIPLFENYCHRLILLLLFAFTLSTVYICHFHLGPVDPYHMSLGLPIIALGLLMPFTIMEISGAYALIWIAYFIPNVLSIQPDQVSQFASNNFFLLTTMTLSVFGSRYRLTQEINQWQSRRRLTIAHHKMKKRAASFEEEARERTNQLIQSERLAVVGQLTGGIAHDFNNLLTSILGVCELQLAVLPKELEVTKDLHLIAQVGKRAANLVKKLLAFSRRQILEPQWVQPNDILNGMESMMQRLIGEQIEVSIINDRQLGTILVDPVQLEQVILNLAVNARDAMPDGGKLLIETENVSLDRLYCHKKGFSIPPGDYVMIAFSDTGHGMLPETQSKIFEPFFTTKEKGQGTGLGLSTVYGIVKQSHGDLFVYSEPDKGTTFKIYLPREKTDVDIASSDYKTTGYCEPKATILLVEDEDQVRLMTARLLEDHGYNVLQACDGIDALELSRNPEHKIDLLITDIVMPELSGLELAQQFRLEKPDTNVLMVSGYTKAMVQQHYNLDDVPHFLQKPFTISQIRNTVEEMLQPSRPHIMPPAVVF